MGELEIEERHWKELKSRIHDYWDNVGMCSEYSESQQYWIREGLEFVLDEMWNIEQEVRRFQENERD